MLQNSGIYIFYILAVLAIGLLCVVTIWLGTRSKNSKVKRQYAARRSQRAVAASGAFKTTRKSRSRRKSASTGSDSRLRGRDEQSIPAIWGW
jgi:Flp pilus assembly protein TadB